MSKNLKKIMGLLVVSILALGFKANVYAGTTSCNNSEIAKVDDSTCYDSLSDALSSVTSGGKVVLSNSTSTEKIVLNLTGTVELDLNGKTITGTADRVFEVTGGELKITNSVEDGTGLIINESSSTAASIYVYTGTKLTVGKKVTIKGINPIMISSKRESDYKNEDTEVTIAGKLLNTTPQSVTSAALTVFGKISNSEKAPKITIEQDAVLSSTVTGGAGIFQSGYAKTTIKGKVSGDTGVVIKSGTLTIEGAAEITADGGYANAVPTGDGFNGTGAAIQIESLNNDIEVNITAGKITSTSNSAILEYTNGSDTKVKKLEVNSSANFSAPADKEVMAVSDDLKTDLAGSGVTTTVEHKITIPTEVSHGKVELEEGKNKDKLLFGEFVTLKVTPDAGYHLGTLKITSDAKPVSAIARIASNDIPYISVSGGYKFRMPNGDVNVEATFVKNSSSSSSNYHLKINIKVKDELIENYVINNGETLNDILNELKTKYSNMVGFTDSDNNKLELDTVAYDGMYLIAVLEDETISESPKTFDAISTIIAISVVSLGAIGFASKKYIKFN